jgi:hypothetical protein
MNCERSARLRAVAASPGPNGRRLDAHHGLRVGACPGVAKLSALLACVVLATSAHADSCGKSRDYILSGAAGNLQHKPQIYQDLFKICLDTLQMFNVKDAFVLKAGAIAVIPKNDGVALTASTLTQFCGRFRRATLRFVARRELHEVANISRVVDLSISGVTPCRTITGSG